MLNYPRITSLPTEYIQEKIAEILKEDIPQDDWTSIATISPESRTKAYIESLNDIIFVGKDIIHNFFSDEFEVKVFANDGDLVYKNGIIAEISGPTIEILKKERSLLNLIQRLSGIATATNKYVEIAEPFGVKILDTRKTTPLLRLFEKYAVTMGSGYNHRMDLSAAILIKDNHIKAAGSITQAVDNALKYNLNIEVEAENFKEVKEICETKANGILLDNMNPEDTKKMVEYIRSKRNKEEFYIISSGGINFQNMTKYLDTGIDGISTGALTHSVMAADIRLEIE